MITVFIAIFILIVIIMLFIVNNYETFESILANNECNKVECNDVMKDWIINNNWSFDDSEIFFGECANCPTRSFEAPSFIKFEIGDWIDKKNPKNAYNSIKIK